MKVILRIFPTMELLIPSEIISRMMLRTLALSIRREEPKVRREANGISLNGKHIQQEIHIQKLSRTWSVIMRGHMIILIRVMRLHGKNKLTLLLEELTCKKAEAG